VFSEEAEVQKPELIDNDLAIFANALDKKGMTGFKWPW
jgi:hypothetical protein